LNGVQSDPLPVSLVVGFFIGMRCKTYLPPQKGEWR
jgi:hypothetical protein